MVVFDVPRCAADWSDTPPWVRWWPVMLVILAGVALLGLAEYVERTTQ